MMYEDYESFRPLPGFFFSIPTRRVKRWDDMFPSPSGVLLFYTLSSRALENTGLRARFAAENQKIVDISLQP